DRGPPRAVILFNHGNGRNITTRRHVIELYRDRMNATVLVYDYRGYGRSDGRPTEAGVLVDARAARRWLATRAGVREGDVVIAGHSLGGGVAVDLAAADGARGLILEGTFTNLPDVAAGHVPLLPVRAVMQARLNSVGKIPAYRGPLLQVHGDADTIVPYALGRRLFAAANEPKQFVTVPGGGHMHLYTPEYVAALDGFLTMLAEQSTGMK
ncbi:MAG TPA: alpha/beta hydrolase, partial [Urbifossiella sp.]|nr:alpha/beta hydrolase [Urbifossiella sp.]